jgi:hypothetical protein
MRTANWFGVVALCVTLPATSLGQKPAKLGPEVLKYVRYDALRIVLTHVRAIDGTGGPPAEDRNTVIENGKVVAIEQGEDMSRRDGEEVLNLRGHSVISGLPGMHDHLFYAAAPNLTADGA